MLLHVFNFSETSSVLLRGISVGFFSEEKIPLQGAKECQVAGSGT